MINALFASQSGGTRMLLRTGQEFGWQAIIDLYKRECVRRDSGHARMVPKLREAYMLRDSWMKLNVMSAKIIQVVIISTDIIFVSCGCTFIAGEGLVRAVPLYFTGLQTR